MITHDLAFENLAKAPVKRTDVVVVRQIISDTGYVDSTPLWESSTILRSVNIDSVGEMLGTVTKKAKVELMGVQEGVVAGDIFRVRLGLDDSGTYNYISQGVFVVDSIDYNYDAGSTTINMYDAMWKASSSLYIETIADGTITYPITVEAMAEYIADVLDLSLAPGFADLPNSQHEIQEDLYKTTTGATIQTAIQDIAGATGSTARVRDNTLEFVQYDVLDENLGSNELKTLKIGDTYGPVTSVILGRVPQNDNIAVYAISPTPNIVTAVDTGANSLTIVEHDMIVGNMVKFASTATLPAPLVADKFYFVTETTVDTFKLSETYIDSLAATGIVNITSAGSGVITIVPLTTKEIQINNNQILDDQRQEMLAPLYNDLAGIDWTYVKASTIGLGWHEVGDVIQFTQGDVTVRAFLSEVHLVLAGSIKETLVSQVPDVAAINYQAAGGILRTLYNTEIKVDKQNQEIISVVSRQDTFEGQTVENFTEIRQDIDDITLTVQKSGGGNLLLNSVGYATEDTEDLDGVKYARLLSWEYPPSYKVSDQGSVISSDSSESQNYGGVSGRLIQMSSNYLAGKTVSLTQRVNLAVGTSLSFGLRVRSSAGSGGATITLSNTTDSFVINIPSTSSYVWEEFKIEDFEVSVPWLDVKIEASASSFRFTDLRLLYGNTLQGWTQSNSELLATNVQFSVDGMRIFDSEHDTETRVTYNEFSTRRKADGTILFEADDVGVVTNNLSIKGTTAYKVGEDTVIKQITIPSTSAFAGIAFVKG